MVRFVPGQGEGVKLYPRDGSVHIGIACSAGERARAAATLTPEAARRLSDQLLGAARDAETPGSAWRGGVVGEPINAVYGPLAEGEL